MSLNERTFIKAEKTSLVKALQLLDVQRLKFRGNTSLQEKRIDEKNKCSLHTAIIKSILTLPIIIIGHIFVAVELSNFV